MIFANVVLRAKTVTKINNTKPNTFAFQFLTLARFSENRVASMMIPLVMDYLVMESIPSSAKSALAVVH